MTTESHIEKMLVASTAHVAGPDELSRLAKEHGYEFPYGVFCHIGEEWCEEELRRWSGGVKQLVLLSEQEGCRWLLLDQDAELIGGVDSYDW